MMFVPLVLLIALASAMTWQHLRYLGIRRNIVQDRQALLRSPDCFHLIVFFEVAEGADVVEQVRVLRSELEAAGPAQLVYAGQAAFTLASAQIGPRSWDGLVMLEYPLRESYEIAAKSERHRAALAAFPKSYSHGMHRRRGLSLMLPQFLLALRTADILSRGWKIEELQPMPDSEIAERSIELKGRVEDLLRLRSVNDKAVVVFNLIQRGSREQQSADRSYSRMMMSRMAGLAHGPMHAGRAVTLEGDAEFEDVFVVYYPGVDYFAELLASRFFQGIVGDKQLGDTQAVPTVPILSLL